MKRIKSILKAILNFIYKDEGIDYKGYIAYDKGVPSLQFKVVIKYKLLTMTFYDILIECKDMMEVNEVLPRMKQLYKYMTKQYKGIKNDRHKDPEAK